jgi:hypothetical protein
LVTVSPGTTEDPVATIVAEVTLDRIDLAYDLDLAAAPDDAVAEQRTRLHRLVSERVLLTTNDGTPWTIDVADLQPSALDGYVTLRIVLEATPPPGAALAGSVLRWDLVTDTVFSHKVFVAVRAPGEDAALVGTIVHHQPTVELDLTPEASPSRGGSLFAVGFEHFRSGPDHLLFLGTLALGVARRARSPRSACRRVAGMTAAFAVGHSLSLALATAGVASLPGRVVETGIAATVVAAAVHAVRPIASARTEVVITLLFGLVHGFGFAGTLTGLALDGKSVLVPLATFNLGLEAAQLLGLIVIAIPVWVISRSAAATTALAAAFAAVALLWVAQRAFDLTTPLEPLLTTALASPERMALLAGVAAAATTAGRSRERPDVATSWSPIRR